MSRGHISMSMVRRDRVLLFATTLFSLVSGTAQSQTAPAQASAATLEEVIVTAQKRAENIQDIPLAITQVDTEALFQRGGSNLEAVQGLVPNVEINTAAAATGVAIRGIYSTNDTQNGDPAVAFHIDGVYLGRPQSVGMLFYDLDRIEVLRGPQGTLYGRNATAGAINVITNRPVFDFEAQAGVEAGNYGLIGTNGMLNAPLGEHLATRLAFRTMKRDGYAVVGSDDHEQIGVRSSTLYQPTDNFSVLLSGHYDKRDGIGPAFYRFGVSGVDPRSTTLPNPGAYINNVNWGVQAELNWNMSFATLTVLPAYHDLEIGYRYATDRILVNTQGADQTSFEVRLASPVEARLNWILGAFYWNEEGDHDNDILPPPIRLQFVTPYVEATSKAAFGQATFRVTERLRLTGGLRYTEDRKQQDGFNLVSQPNGTVIARVSSLSDATWNELNWRLSTELDVTDQSMLYATAATGYKSGGIFDGLPPNSYEPEKLLSFEIGSKNRFFNDVLQLNISAFRYEYENYQATQLGCLNLPAGAPPCSASGRVTYNADSATVMGIEAEGQWAITSNDRLNFSAAYTEGKFDEFILPVTPFAPGGVFSGNPLPKSPKYQAALDYSHIFNLANGGDITANARVRHTDDQYLLFDIRSPLVRQEAYTMTDVSATYTSPKGRYGISAYVNNATDELVKAHAFFGFTLGGYYGSYLPPRTYGMRLNVNF